MPTWNKAKGTLQQAEATLAQSRADQLKSGGRAWQDANRCYALHPFGEGESAISQQELDDAIQANLGAKAQVEAAKSCGGKRHRGNRNGQGRRFWEPKRAVETAKLNLGFTSITSPVDGIASIATAQLGDLVGPQTNTLTTVSTVKSHSRQLHSQ